MSILEPITQSLMLQGKNGGGVNDPRHQIELL